MYPKITSTSNKPNIVYNGQLDFLLCFFSPRKAFSSTTASLIWDFLACFNVNAINTTKPITSSAHLAIISVLYSVPNTLLAYPVMYEPYVEPITPSKGEMNVTKNAVILS